MADSLNDNVKALFAALPTMNANPVGRVARDVLVNRAKGATPGRATTYSGDKGDLFKQIFFPNYQTKTYEGAVNSVTGLGDSFWSDMSIALLCDAMYLLTSSLRPRILLSNVRNDLGNWNGQIYSKGATWYGYLLPQVSPEVGSPFNAIPQAERPQALQFYSDSLKSSEWITAKRAQFLSGTWTDRDWELYHHWIKLQILGASTEFINGVINYLISQNLPVPENVNANNWRQYSGWSGSAITGQDVQREASNGILKEECFAFPGAMPGCMGESNSYEFTAQSQPGNKYRQVPGSSCLKAGALVVMADSSLKPIEEIRPGDQVLTPGGPRPVAVISTPLRLKRTLYSFEGLDFQFTATQPFITYASLGQAEAPTFTCIDPLRLIDTVPTLSQLGVVPLKSKSGPTLCKFGEGGPQPFDVPLIVEHGAGGEDELLYDLVVDMQGSGSSEYYAGDSRETLLFSSEIPRYGVAPETTHAILTMLSECQESVLETIKDVPDEDVTDVLQVGIAAVAGQLLPAILRQIHTEPGEKAALPVASTADIDAMVAQALSMFNRTEEVSGEMIFQNRLGELYTFLAAFFGQQFMSAIDLGWRDLTHVMDRYATMLSVSVYCIELDGSFDLPAGTPLNLGIELSYNGARFNRRLPSFTPSDRSGYYHQFEEVAYFDTWRPPVGSEMSAPPWTIEFTLHRANNDERVGGAAYANLPDSLENGFRQEKALVLDAEGTQIGQITFDLRPLDDIIFAREREAKQQWTPEKKQRLALAIGVAAGKFMSQHFPDAARLFSITASAQSRNVFPPVNPPSA